MRSVRAFGLLLSSQAVLIQKVTLRFHPFFWFDMFLLSSFWGFYRWLLLERTPKPKASWILMSVQQDAFGKKVG
jgi:hypothetical protein